MSVPLSGLADAPIVPFNVSSFFSSAHKFTNLSAVQKHILQYADTVGCDMFIECKESRRIVMRCQSGWPKQSTADFNKRVVRTPYDITAILLRAADDRHDDEEDLHCPMVIRASVLRGIWTFDRRASAFKHNHKLTPNQLRERDIVDEQPNTARQPKTARATEQAAAATQLEQPMQPLIQALQLQQQPSPLTPQYCSTFAPALPAIALPQPSVAPTAYSAGGPLTAAQITAFLQPHVFIERIRPPLPPAIVPVYVVQLQAHQFSRILYPNPVCLLTTHTCKCACSCSAPTAPSQPPAFTQPHPTFRQPFTARRKGQHSAHASIDTHISTMSTMSTSLPCRNVMTISWITATSNHGELICSMNHHRYSFDLIAVAQRCVLNIPVRGMEDTVRAIGAASGRDDAVDKFLRLGIPMCAVGWKELADADVNNASNEDEWTLQSPQNESPMETPKAAAPSFASHNRSVSHGLAMQYKQQRRGIAEVKEDVSGVCSRCLTSSDIAIPSACAQLVCQVVRCISDVTPSHRLLVMKVISGYVRSDYWSGAIFAPQSPAVPPYLKFLGSQQFGYVER